MHKVKTLKSKKAFSPYLYIIPAAIIVILFRFIPILLSFILSFFKWTIKGPEKLIGFANYYQLLNDTEFWQSLTNTFYLVIFVVPITLILSLLFANLLNRTTKLSGLFRTTYFIPTVTSLVALSIVWKLIFGSQSGLMNHILGFFGIHGLGWLSESRGIFNMLFGAIGINIPKFLGGPSLALFAIIIVSIWRSLGYNTIIFLAGLQNIPEVYYEAAEIDGASKIKQFFKITIPLISPTTFYVLIMTTIVTFQVFAQVYMMTGPPVGGPLGTTKVIVYYIFEKGIDAQEFSYASAIALVLFFIILSLTMLQKKLEKKVQY
ncbi:MAG: sugar ABC transporter permease [Candidatus Cloacimonetes bacterium]|nr:sugar ABC transporter permease [Candidatus Cloacimonadota bacterium]MBL7086319.1 sugar ABC transporter permease [Candidatus Cloacimonadota bacterium]